MKIDYSRLSKEDIVKRARWHCPHGKNGLEHPNCFVTLSKVYTGPRIAILDIETEDLSAEYGIMFNWCLMDYSTKQIFKDRITLDDIRKASSHKRDTQTTEDSRIVQNLIKLMEDYDFFVLHFGSRFDIPFIRTRAKICGLDFFKFGEKFVIDTWRNLKYKYKLRSNRLEHACQVLVGQTRKDHLNLTIKHGCIRGEKWALDACEIHCVNDVKDTLELWDIIKDDVKWTRTSI